MKTIFYGWRIVGICFVAAVFTWGFGTFGNSVYLAEITMNPHFTLPAFVWTLFMGAVLRNACRPIPPTGELPSRGTAMADW